MLRPQFLDWFQRLDHPWSPFRRAMAVAVASCLVLAVGAGCDDDASVRAPLDESAEAPEVVDVDVDGPADAQLASATDEQLRQSIYYPSGEAESSVLLIQQVGPAQVRLGQPYQYQIQVKNLTDAPLAGVQVRQLLPPGFEIGQSQPPGQRAQPTGAMAAQAGATTQPAQPPPPPQQQAQSGQQQQSPTTRPGGQQQQQMSVYRWPIGELDAGEIRTIQVTAYPHTVGQIASCITVDYQPTLCAMTTVVNPELRLTKQGPSQVDVCQPLTWTYTVWNDGTGTLQNVRIEDPLPEGLTNEQGEQKLVIEVGDLPAGTSKEFTIALKPTRPGQFASRAVAHSADDEAYSNEVSTQVVQPSLAVNVQAPQWRYVNERVPFEITVTNTGKAPAPATTLAVDVPETGELVAAPEGMLRDDAGEAQLAAARESELPAGEPGAYELGTLAPGQSRTITVLMRGTEQGSMQLGAIATTACEAAGEAARAQAAAQTYIAVIPALVMEVVDRVDPVEVGQNTVYEIAVKNQGSGADHNVQLTATLPEGLEFIEAEGSTEVKADGNTITFGPIQTIEPGQTMAWQVVARAQNPADARFQLELKSKSLTRPATEEEPTRLIR